MNKTRKRSPRAFNPGDAQFVSREPDIGTDDELADIAPPDTESGPAIPEAGELRRGLRWSGIFFGAAGGLLALAAGIWFNDLVAGLLARNDWVGWSALALLALVVVAAAMIVVREIWAILRLRRLGRIHDDADSALRHDDKDLAGSVDRQVRALYRGRRELAWALSRLREHDGDIMDAGERLALLERELLTPIDRSAQSVIAGTAKRVSVITAVSPVATLDMAIVAAQNLKMLRRIATLYGARPGTLGLFRLARMVLGHIVLTGGIAFSDDIIQQLVGHRLMAKLSARLGEGLFNGALTARIGMAAIEVCRPLPFVKAQPPRIRNVLAELARQVASKA